LDTWPGRYLPGADGKLLRELANDSLMCINANHDICERL